jgi:hypothetical protein
VVVEFYASKGSIQVQRNSDRQQASRRQQVCSSLLSCSEKFDIMKHNGCGFDEIEAQERGFLRYGKAGHSQHSKIDMTALLTGSEQYYFR